MTVLNTADWLLSCSTPSSATSMSNPGIVHVCAWLFDCCVDYLTSYLFVITSHFVYQYTA